MKKLLLTLIFLIGFSSVFGTGLDTLKQFSSPYVLTLKDSSGSYYYKFQRGSLTDEQFRLMTLRLQAELVYFYYYK